MSARPDSDPYSMLGVTPQTDLATIRKAYLALARRMHPDANSERSTAERAFAERRMREINGAWQAIHDGTARSQAGSPNAKVKTPNPRPEAKPWRPTSSDNDWMDDFDEWKDSSDRLGEDETGEPAPVRLLPPLLLLCGGLVLMLGVILMLRPVVALGFSALAVAAVLWIWLPFAEMARSTRRNSKD